MIKSDPETPVDTKRATFANKKTIMVGQLNTSFRKEFEEQHNVFLIWPWSPKYRMWWALTVFGAMVTVFTETFAVAFVPAGLEPFNDASSIVEFVLVTIFALDMMVNFFLAYHDENEELITDRKKIAIHYLKGMFKWDLLGVFPLYLVALAISGQIGENNSLTQYLALLRLVKLVRLHRMAQLFQILKYTQRVSLTYLTITRNLVFALVWSHISACTFYFIAKQYDYDTDGTWIGAIDDLDGSERYITSLYLSVVTLTTVGYGDYHPVNKAEMIWAMIFMLLNIICQAWIIGSITLLVVKEDAKTGEYRESLAVLKKYSDANELPPKIRKSLKAQLKLEFSNGEISDENVLQQFPANTRRKVLRRLYLPCLMQTRLMKGVLQQFIDAFLSACRVEIFGPGEDIVMRGTLSTDLYLLVFGTAKAGVALDSQTIEDSARDARKSSFGGTSAGDSEYVGSKHRMIEDGEFLNEVGFFTESPQVETVVTKTVCKTLTLSRSAYKDIAGDHPGSIGIVLKNLLEKVEEMVEEAGSADEIDLPTKMQYLRAGSIYTDTSKDENETRQAIKATHAESALTTVQDLIIAHMNKQRDDHTTRFLFAASRSDTSTLHLMCKQGFDPDERDYDSRTALMVASMKGNTEAVKMLLDFEANPNLVDMHGTSALYEAVRNGHDETIKLLMQKGGELCLEGGDAASKLCQTVFDGDLVSMKRLLKAGIPVNSADYDKRTAAHIAAAEGNLAALKLLAEFDADMFLGDRWGNTAEDEVKRLNSVDILAFIAAVKQGKQGGSKEMTRTGEVRPTSASVLFCGVTERDDES